MKFTSCIEKQNYLEKNFLTCTTQDDKYLKIIELGKNLPLLNSEHKTESNKILGCQSEMFLYTRCVDQQMIFEADSEALISKGLAALLIYIYNFEAPEIILKCPPTVLQKLSIPQLLSPSRSNGLSSLFIRMKQEAANFLVAQYKGAPLC
jgi:cysteine desulfuration protein SufE